MDLLEKLRAKRAKAVEAMRGILNAAKDDSGEPRDLTPEETAQYDALKAEVEALNPQIERLEAQDELETELSTIIPGAGRRAGGRRVDLPGGPAASKEFETLGQFMYAVRFNPNDQRLDFHAEVGATPELEASQSMGTGSEGGFMVPTQFRDTLLQVTPQTAMIRSRAMVIPAGDPPDSAVTMPALDQTTTNNSNPSNVYGGVTVGWGPEAGAVGETDADLRQVTLTPKEVTGYIKTTDKLLRNWQAAGPVLERLLRGAVISAEETGFLTGLGTNKPLGIVPAGASYAVNRGTATTFKHADLSNMQARLKAGGSPVWFISQSVMPQLLNMRNEIGSPAVGDGSLVWNPNVKDGNGFQLLNGIPIVWHERSPALGTKGDVVLADLEYYLIKDGSGPFVSTSEHVNFLTNQTVVKVVWNVDGSPWLTAPFTQEGGYQVSPFVVLDVPA